MSAVCPHRKRSGDDSGREIILGLRGRNYCENGDGSITGCSTRHRARIFHADALIGVFEMNEWVFGKAAALVGPEFGDVRYAGHRARPMGYADRGASQATALRGRAVPFGEVLFPVGPIPRRSRRLSWVEGRASCAPFPRGRGQATPLQFAIMPRGSPRGSLL